ncbi:hypothetical protein [Undibacterium squillarum]|uniref:hypothetical protein n=1 Tax=Undibacterium squillarum TaxID=1131567 RepID=UPI0035B1B933
MELHFSWYEFNSRFYPRVQCHNNEEEGLSYPFNLLVDDGGLGFIHHLSWLKEGSSMCERVIHGNSMKEFFTTELFAADIASEGVSIYDITAEPTDGVLFSLQGFYTTINEWINFLERGKDIEKPCEVFVFNYVE